MSSTDTKIEEALKLCIEVLAKIADSENKWAANEARLTLKTLEEYLLVEARTVYTIKVGKNPYYEHIERKGT